MIAGHHLELRCTLLHSVRMMIWKVAAKVWSKLRKGARENPVPLTLLALLDGAVIGSAFANFHRFGVEGVIWATLLVGVVTVGALYQNFGEPDADWPRRD